MTHLSSLLGSRPWQSFIFLRLQLIAVLLFSLLSLAIFSTPSFAEEASCQHALTLHGSPKYAANFSHFDYVNPNAPKGGTLSQAAQGTFDSLNPFIMQGTVASGLGNIYDTLTQHSADEPFSEYGLLAKCIKLDPAGQWVEFELRPEAKFHDGTPVTSADVKFTFELLTTQGKPFYRAYYAGISKILTPSPHTVRFELATPDNKELPLIIGQIPILPKHFWQDKDFTKLNLDFPLGSGPYQVKSLEAGRRITYQRVKDYWAANLNVNLGHNNFAELVYDYYRDATVALEAFKAGQLNFRYENVARNWAKGYSGSRLNQGEIKLVSLKHKNSAGMQGFFFNSRNPVFSDRKVRLALTQMFDFEWSNQQLFFNAYTRTNSYFANSELASSGLPEGAELALLEEFKSQLPEEVFTQEYRLPVTQGDGNLRPQIRKALQLLQEAGWQLKGRKLVNSQGKVFKFEILLYDSSFERVVLPFRRNLERLGIEVSVRLVDVTQYLNRLRSYDFDLIVSSLGQSLSPGNEQREYFHSEFTHQLDGRNLAGISHPVIDALVEKVIHASNRQELITATRALDRVLLWQHYVIPQMHINEYRLALHKDIQLPQTSPAYGLVPNTWWHSFNN